MEMIGAVVTPDGRNAIWSLKERVGEDEEVQDMRCKYHASKSQIFPLINVKNDVYKNGYKRRSCTSKTAKFTILSDL